MYQSGGGTENRLKSTELRCRKSCECCIAAFEMWHNRRHDQRLMLQSCRNTAKHPDTVRDTRLHSDIAVSENSKVTNNEWLKSTLVNSMNTCTCVITLLELPTSNFSQSVITTICYEI